MFYSKMQIENSTCLLNVLTKYQVIFLWDELRLEKYTLLVKDSPHRIFYNLAWALSHINDSATSLLFTMRANSHMGIFKLKFN